VLNGQDGGVCLLVAFPPAGIAYWIVTARRQAQAAVPGRSPLASVLLAGWALRYRVIKTDSGIFQVGRPSSAPTPTASSPG
jgi:hypothetical protein